MHYRYMKNMSEVVDIIYEIQKIYAAFTEYLIAAINTCIVLDDVSNRYNLFDLSISVCDWLHDIHT